MNKCEVCRKELKGTFKRCFQHKDVTITSSQTAEGVKPSVLGLDHSDRILRAQCLNIASEQLMGNSTKDTLLKYAKDLYDLIKKDGWL